MEIASHVNYGIGLHERKWLQTQSKQSLWWHRGQEAWGLDSQQLWHRPRFVVEEDVAERRNWEKEACERIDGRKTEEAKGEEELKQKGTAGGALAAKEEEEEQKEEEE